MVNAVAIMYFVVGGLNLTCALLILAGGTFLSRMTDDTTSRVAINSVAGVIALVVVLLGVPDLIAGYGIWHRRYWGYVLGLVLAGINALWALASIMWVDVCSLAVCGSCSIFAFVVLLNSRYSDEFT